jgi:hypothetical protein
MSPAFAWRESCVFAITVPDVSPALGMSELRHVRDPSWLKLASAYLMSAMALDWRPLGQCGQHVSAVHLVVRKSKAASSGSTSGERRRVRPSS